MVVAGIRQCQTGPDLLRRKSNTNVKEGWTTSSGPNNISVMLSACSEKTAKLNACSFSTQVTPSGDVAPSVEIQVGFFSSIVISPFLVVSAIKAPLRVGCTSRELSRYLLRTNVHPPASTK